MCERATFLFSILKLLMSQADEVSQNMACQSLDPAGIEDSPRHRAVLCCSTSPGVSLTTGKSLKLLPLAMYLDC